MGLILKIFQFLRNKENRDSALAIASIFAILGSGIAWGVKTFLPDVSTKELVKSNIAETSKILDSTAAPQTSDASNSSHPKEEVKNEEETKNNISIQNSSIITGDNANVTINQNK